MDFMGVMLSEVRERRNIGHPLYAESKKEIIQLNLITKEKQTQRLRERTYGYQRGRVGMGRIDSEFGIDMYTLLYLK